MINIYFLPPLQPGHLTLSSPCWSASTLPVSSCGQPGPCSTSAARTVRNVSLSFYSFAKNESVLISVTVHLLTPATSYFYSIPFAPRSHSLLQHAPGGGRPAAIGAGSHAPADPRRRQTSGKEHPGEPTEPPGPHRPGGVHTHESPCTASVTAQTGEDAVQGAA